MLELIINSGIVTLWGIVSIWLIFTTFLFYVMIMHVIKVRQGLGRLHWFLKVLIVPWLIIGGLSNVLLNIVVATVVCLDPPYLHRGEFFTTKRMQRYRAGHRGLLPLPVLVKWRLKVANFVCSVILNPFDKGHC